MIRIDFNERKVRIAVRANDFSPVSGLIRKAHAQSSRITDHVIVRQNISHRVDDDARTGRKQRHIRMG